MVADLEREGLRRQVGTTVVAGWLAASCAVGVPPSR
jgi:hypothetical protein